MSVLLKTVKKKIFIGMIQIFFYYRRSDFLQLLVDVAITEKEELAKTGENSKRCK